eukprot:7859059-Karenia_brevis.AAC.1
MGQTVIDGDQPCVWVKGIMLFHVTDSSKLKIYCPEEIPQVCSQGRGIRRHLGARKCISSLGARGPHWP